MIHSDSEGGDYLDGLSGDNRFKTVANIWDGIDSEDSCATDGVALEQLRRDVTEAMVRRDAGLAESLTAKALFLITGDF